MFDLVLLPKLITAGHSLQLKYTRIKNIKNVTRCTDSRSAKSTEQGKDDSIKQFSIQPHPTYLSTSKICRVELCTELFYAIIPTLSLCFLLICYPYILLHF